MSPAVWPRPRWISSTRRLPRWSVSLVGKVMVGQVRPGIVSAAWNRRGKRPYSLSQSSLPRSTISARVASDARISSAPVGRRAEHAHRVVVAEHDVADRLVGDLPDALDHLLRHGGRRLGVDHHHAVVADDHARVRIALGGERVAARADLAERDLLRPEVAGRCERLAHDRSSRLRRPAACSARLPARSRRRSSARRVQHLDAHAVAELQPRRPRRTVPERLQHAPLGEARRADRGALLARRIVRDRARADDGAGRQMPGRGRVRDQLREVEGHVDAGVWAARAARR